MENFDFPYHVTGLAFPDTSGRMKFGKGYEFASRAKGPPQKIYKLSFSGMQAFTNTVGVVNPTINPQRNILMLKAFYERHECWKTFQYNHPEEGTVTVRFNKPLEYNYKRAGLGAVEDFTIELILQP